MDKELTKVQIIYEAINKIIKFIDGFNNVAELTENAMAWDAVKMNLVLIYETYLKLNGSVKEKFSSVPWQEIEIHKPILENQLLGFDSDEIWRVIHDKMPKFRQQLKEVIDN